MVEKQVLEGKPQNKGGSISTPNKLRVLNLYCGIGGNRKLWPDDEIEVTAVEINPEIAKIYEDFFPGDKVIVGDAHQYLLDHFKEFDFIWSSPPCPTHSRIRTLWGADVEGKTQNIVFPDMTLYQEIILLQHFFKGKWIVENVISYYEPLIKPFISGNHYFWSNCHITNMTLGSRLIRRNHGHTIKRQNEWGFIFDNNINLSSNEKAFRQKIINNCVEPKLGLHVWKCVFKEKQPILVDWVEKNVLGLNYTN